MANRYKNKKAQINEEGKKYFKTSIATNIPIQNSDLRIVARAGDRLDVLALKYYNNSTYWWIIAEANGVGKGSLFVKPGTFLRIPVNLAKIEQEQDKLDEGRL
jgi:nucleoid-associated protein YgaU